MAAFIGHSDRCANKDSIAFPFFGVDMLGFGVSGRRSTMALVAAVLFLPAVAAAGWWQASPAYAVARLQQAALSGDGADVAARIDFPALRQSLKAELRVRLLAEAKPETSSLSVIGTGLALAFIDPMVDAAVTPETVATSVSVAGQWTGPSALAAIGVLSFSTAELRIDREGLDRFSLRASTFAATPALVFCRDGLHWELCAVDLSQEV